MDKAKVRERILEVEIPAFVRLGGLRLRHGHGRRFGLGKLLCGEGLVRGE